MADMRKGIEGNRANFAYQKVLEILKKEDKVKKEYKSYVKKIPMLIKTNGLGATFAFICSKAKNNIAYKEIYDHVQEWIKINEISCIDLVDNETLMEKIIKLESSLYRALTIEILALFSWLRRFADGMIEGE